jgi:hypothetical protein
MISAHARQVADASGTPRPSHPRAAAPRCGVRADTAEKPGLRKIVAVNAAALRAAPARSAAL